LARAFDDPRVAVIIDTTTSPPTSRPTQTGSRNGGFAPTHEAKCGSHCDTGAGSSSTMLKTPRARCSSASTVAAAASSTCSHDAYAVPPPTSGNRRLRTIVIMASLAPGP
jgi:hypothetical protein